MNSNICTHLIIKLVLLTFASSTPLLPFIRTLTQSEQTHNSTNPTTPSTPQHSIIQDINTFLFVFLIIIILLALTGLISFIVWAVRFFLYIGAYRSRNRIHSIGDDQYDMVRKWPAVEYWCYFMYIGWSLVDQCAICLDGFNVRIKQKTDVLQIIKIEELAELQRNREIDKNKNIQTTQDQPAVIPQINHQYKVKLTICGHLFHEKCINKWLEKQIICPMCRVKFTSHTFRLTGLKLGVDFIEWLQNINKLIKQNCNQHNKQQQNRASIKNKHINVLNQEQNHTLNQLQASSIEPQANQCIIGKLKQIKPVDRGILLMYQKIMSQYYQSQKENKRGITVSQQIITMPQSSSHKKIKETVEAQTIRSEDSIQFQFKGYKFRKQKKKEIMLDKKLTVKSEIHTKKEIE